MTLVIKHTYQGGTTLEGSAKGDGTAEVMKRLRWRWWHSIGVWGIQSSRDHLSNTWKITAAKQALEEAGFEVELDIDNTVPDIADVEASKMERAEGRAEALEAKADRYEAKADAAWLAHDRAQAQVPPDGQPILVGHHSEKRHRAAIERSRQTMRKALDVQAEADRVADRAEAAQHATGRRYNPVTVQNRIHTLEADIRRWERCKTARAAYTGHESERYTAMIAEASGQLAFWQGVRDEQKAQGIRAYGPDSIRKGDWVSTDHGRTFDEVVRVNRKSVTVALAVMGGMQMLQDYARITDTRAAA